MASVTTLGFSILSRYSGHGVTQARRDLAALRAQMATTNSDLKKHSDILGGIPARWKAIGSAAVVVAPALVPLAAQLLATSGALVTMTAAAGVAGGAWGLALKGALGRINDTNLGLVGLEKNLAKQKAILANMTPGTDHYGKQLEKVAKAQDQYNHVLKDADPAQQKFMNAMLGMDTAWQKFISSTQGQTLGVAAKVMDALGVAVAKLVPLVSAVTPLANKMAEAFGHWVDIKMDGWVDFFSKTGVAALSQFVTIGKNLGATFGIMLKAFAGDADKLGNSLAVASGKLKNWAEGGGFDRFLKYVHDNAPMVNHMLKEFLKSIGNIIRVLDGFKGASTDILVDFFRVISTIKVENIKAFANTFILLHAPLAWLILNCPPLRDLIIKLLDAMNPTMIYAIAAAFVVLRVAFMLMNTALLTTPLGWLILGLVALGVAIAVIATKTTWFQTAWKYTWNFIKDVSLTVWDALKVAWSATVGALITAWQAVSGALVTAWNAVWNGISVAVNAVWTALKVAWSAVSGWFMTAWNAVAAPLQAAWSAVWGVISDFAHGVWLSMQQAWQAAVAVFQAVWSVVGPVLQAAWTLVWNTMAVAAGVIWTGMQAAWTVAVAVFSTVWTAFSTVFSTAWNLLWTTIKTVAEGVWTALTAAWSVLWTGIQAVWTVYSTVFSAAWNVWWTAVKTAATLVWDALKLAWTLLWTTLTTAWNVFSVAFKALWDAFWIAVKAVWDTFVATITAAWSVFWTALQTTASGIWDIIKGLWNTFVNEGILGVWNTASETIKKAWEDVWNWMKDTAKKIWDEIGGVIEKAINGIIGIINKIIGAWNKIAGAVGLDSLKLDTVGEVKFANGGMVDGTPSFSAGGSVNMTGGGALGGYAPGRDTVHAVLSRGEGVLVPEAVRGLGGAKFVHWANSHYSNGRGGQRVNFPGYNQGKSESMGFATGGMIPRGGAVGGGVEAYRRKNDGTGWGFFQGGGILDPDGGTGSGGLPGLGGTLDNAPNRSDITGVNKDDDGGGFFGTLGDIAGTVLGLDGIGGAVLGFLGREAIEKAFDFATGMLDGFNVGGDFGKMMVAGTKKIVKGMIEELVRRDEEAKKEYEAKAVAGAQSVSAWGPLAAKALAMAGISPSQLPAFLALMAAESGGNPNAINNWDVNARNGVPSQGLMQVIPTTFAAYHVAGTSNNILDPLANMAASAAYIRARYGGSVPGSPYALGTSGATSGMHLVGENGPEMVNFDGGETVTPAGETASILGGVGTPAAMASAAPTATAPAGGAALGGGSAVDGSSVSTPGDVQALIESLLASSEQLQAAMAAMWQKVIASTNTGWTAINGESLTPMNAALAGTVPASLTAMGAAWTAGWTKASADSTAQWTAMSTTAFTPMNAMMSTEVPAAADTMSTGVTTATTAMQTGVQESWDATLQGTQTTWTGVETAITDSVTAATTPINGLLGGFNNVSSALGMGISVPLIAFEAGGVAQFSTGGMLAKNGGAVPGYSPGRDTFAAMLSPGEGVLTPEAVRGLGGAGFVYAANRKYSGHRGGGGSSSESLGKYMGHDARCGHATGGMAGVSRGGVQHFASGTISAQDAAGLSDAGIGTGSVVQGSFNSSVAASGSTHSGDGVVDLSDLGSVGALRNAGWAAWERGPAQGFSPHVHAVYMKATGVDPSAMGQEISYINGGEGLPAGSASTAETNRWGLNLGEWNFGPLIKEIVEGGITSVPKLLGPLVKKHLTKDQVASGFSGLKAALDGTNMGTGMFADSLMGVGTKTHDGIVDNIAGQIGSASFDNGGLLQPGYTLAHNGTGKPEPVGHNLEPKGSQSGPITFEIHTHGSADAQDVVDGINSQVLPKLRQYLNKGTGSN